MGFLVKLLLKAGITLGVMFIGYKYILTGGIGGFQIPGMENIAKEASSGISTLENAVVDEDVTVYKWVDDKGVTHFGGTPPTGQGAYDKQEIRTNTNLMSAQKTQAEEEETKPTRGRVTQVGNIYSPEGIKDLMDDAKNTTQEMNDRSLEQKKILDDILGKPGSKK